MVQEVSQCRCWLGQQRWMPGGRLPGVRTCLQSKPCLCGMFRMLVIVRTHAPCLEVAFRLSQGGELSMLQGLAKIGRRQIVASAYCH